MHMPLDTIFEPGFSAEIISTHKGKITNLRLDYYYSNIHSKSSSQQLVLGTDDCPTALAGTSTYCVILS